MCVSDAIFTSICPDKMHFSTLWFYDKSDDFSFLLILVLIYEQFPHYSSLQKMWTYDDDIVSTWAKLPQYLYAPKNNQNKTFCQTFFSWVQFDNEFSPSYLDKELLPYEMSLQTLRVLNSKNPICSEYWSILFYFCAFFVDFMKSFFNISLARFSHCFER